MSARRQSLGRWGEMQAAAYLSSRGYRILARNVRTEYGEIDLVTHHNEMTVFVEVKTRTTRAYGWPEESITRRKQAHLVAAAQAYLVANPHLDGDWRIDVIAVERPRPGVDPSITHYENAITG